MSGFVEQFRIASSRGEDAPAEAERRPPVWAGPPEDELGVVVPQSLVLGRSTSGVIALRYVTSFSSGLLLDLVAAAKDLKESRAQALFHEQHLADPSEGLPDGFLRVGVEFPDGRQASNLSRRGFWQADSEPEAPVLFQAGGGGGSAGAGRVRMNPGYWLWPLPPAGSLRLFVEWPIVAIELSVAELACAPLLDAAARSEMLWADQP